MREYSLSKRLVEGYLHQPYSWFLNRHSADLGKTILSEVGKIIGSGMKPFIELISKTIVTIMLIVLLVIVDPKLMLVISISLSIVYGIIFFSIRNYLNQIGKKRLKNNQIRFTTVTEAFGASKEIKVGGLEQTYIDSFSNSAKIFALTQASLLVVSQLPRFFLEAIAFGGIMLILLYKMTSTGSFNNALPIISLYVFAGYRLIPALQLIYVSLTKLTFVGPSLDKLCEDLGNLKPTNKIKQNKKLNLNKEIILKNVYYNYPNAERTAIKNIDLVIPAKSTIGFVGPTGSGKTTTVDIILGLLEPQKGKLEVDGEVISKKILDLGKALGYVPQHIFLSDDTVEANIAFGVDQKEIDKNLVEKAAKIANLHQFIIEELPQEYQTTIGERGVRLSGGQRQRIGIARALYHQPKALVLDEATSALDKETEKNVMEAVNNLSKDLTIILIAHRLNTVRNCDIVFKLDKGQLIASGKYEDIIDEI